MIFWTWILFWGRNSNEDNFGFRGNRKKVQKVKFSQNYERGPLFKLCPYQFLRSLLPHTVKFLLDHLIIPYFDFQIYRQYPIDGENIETFFEKMLARVSDHFLSIVIKILQWAKKELKKNIGTTSNNRSVFVCKIWSFRSIRPIQNGQKFVRSSE